MLYFVWVRYMANTFLTYVNDTLVRLNEVELTATTFSDARGVQTQAKNAVNQAIRFINQREFGWPFNHAEANVTLTAGVTRYTAPTNTKTIDYDSFRIRKDADLGASSTYLSKVVYKDYLENRSSQEDLSDTTTLSSGIDDEVVIIPVASTTGFTSTGTIVIGSESITYTGITATSFTGATRGASSSTEAAHDSAATVAQFSSGGVPQFVFRGPNDSYGLSPFPNKRYALTFDYYTYPSADLSAHSDTTTVPDRFKHVIIDGAISYMYFFRGEVPLYERSFALFNDGIKNMQTLLINRNDYVRSTYITSSALSSGFSSSSF